MKTLPKFVQLSTHNSSLILECSRNTPVVLYYGKLLSENSAEMIGLLSTRQEAKCALQEEVPISLSPCLGNGFTGSPGINVFNEDHAWSVGAELIDIEQPTTNHVIFVSYDSQRNIEIKHSIKLDHATNVLSAFTSVSNLNSMPLHINDCCAPTFTLPDHVNKILSFEGRWSMEFQQTSIDLFLGAFVRENRKGKTSHDNFPGVIVHAPHTNETQGDAYAFHLGWSGNHHTRVELLPEQRTYVQMGELLGNSEVVLETNEKYTSPILYVSYSDNGFGDLSNNFHQFVRKNLLNPKIISTPRPVHYNTWEGIYFEHDTDTLKSLAQTVAELGAERFVLDDGWFKYRRHDGAGLGDWTVDDGVYPNGLKPIISHVKQLGMEFGIWFEPEMVNPDSDLYREHPDWVLATAGNPQISFRNQLVLDLTRSEVTDYLLNQIDDLLTQHPEITYIKWDMNRDINHTGNQYGKSAIHQQTLAVYALIDQIKVLHPQVDIESCSSGGARIDYGVMAHTDRVWTSDSNDALDRLAIQRGCSFFFPPEVMGSHVGPRDCHITGRRISMNMRIAVALFGSMGMEMDPRELTETDKLELKNGISLYKAHRELLHSGRLYRSNQDGLSIDFGVVAQDQSSALFAYNSVVESRRTIPKKYRFQGLKNDAEYQFNLVWPIILEEYSPSVLSSIEGKSFSGEALMQFGMQLPITYPQTSLIFKLTKK